MKVIYKIPYPNGRPTSGRTHGTLNYTEVPEPHHHDGLRAGGQRDFRIRMEILGIRRATEAETGVKEVEFIRRPGSNDPAIGDNRWPTFRGQAHPVAPRAT